MRDDGSDQDPGDPQSWNLYSYVRNNPVNNVDPDGHDCVYLNDTGNDAESVDNHSSPAECQATGGAWADGTITNVTTDPNSNNILIQTAQREDNGNIGYVTTETAPGQWSPGTELDQVATSVNALRTNDFILGFSALSTGVGTIGGRTLDAFDVGDLTTLDLKGPTIIEPTPGQIAQAQRVMVQRGRAGVEKAIRSLERRILEHGAKIAEADGYTSSMQREIRNFKQLVQAYKRILGE